MLSHRPTIDYAKRLSAIKKRSSIAIQTTCYRMDDRGSISVGRQGFRNDVTTTSEVNSDSKVIVKEAPF
jgi:hypothetical protein